MGSGSGQPFWEWGSLWWTGQEPGRANVGSSSDFPRTWPLGPEWAGGLGGGREGGEASGGNERYGAVGGGC